MENIKEQKIEKSDSIKELATALAKFQGEVKSVPKDSENPFFKSKYASLEKIIEVIKEPLAKNGLSYAQFPTGKNVLITLLMHNTGEYIMSSVEMTPKDTTPQAHGSALTYMRRYSISAILGVATEEDDGNVASKPATNKTIVKNEKVGAGDIYPDVVLAIEKAKSQKVLMSLSDNAEKSDKLTDTQKDVLQKMISRRVDELEIKIVTDKN